MRDRNMLLLIYRYSLSLSQHARGRAKLNMERIAKNRNEYSTATDHAVDNRLLAIIQRPKTIPSFPLDDTTNMLQPMQLT